ncbi:hypothetical protein AURDEDRAFT_172559 [Auricularia subglabra TFB-10046 SS5]|nr:hypothetical protein AURDEDRAFT_172559 [Auricularia subglabra TFB-10046 SS5]
MLCRRLAYPARLADYVLMFGWEKSRLSRISRATASYILSRWWHLLSFDSNRLTPDQLAAFAAAIHRKGAPLEFCWGFIDGTLCRVARPIRNQRIIYNGWKCFTCLKYQAVNMPDGIIVYLFGPVEGQLHDSMLYKLSGLERILAQYSFTQDGWPLVIYGDPAYGPLTT